MTHPGTMEDCLLTWDSDLTERTVFDSVTTILMTSSSPIVRKGGKGKAGFPRRVLRRLTSCQKCKRLLTSSCWLPTSDSDWEREDNGLVETEFD